MLKQAAAGERSLAQELVMGLKALHLDASLHLTTLLSVRLEVFH